MGNPRFRQISLPTAKRKRPSCAARRPSSRQRLGMAQPVQSPLQRPPRATPSGAASSWTATTTPPAPAAASAAPFQRSELHRPSPHSRHCPWPPALLLLLHLPPMPLLFLPLLPLLLLPSSPKERPTPLGGRPEGLQGEQSNRPQPGVITP